MTCKDCVHYEVCAYLHDTESVDFAETKPLHCDHFKPKSRFVEVVRCKDCKYCEVVTDQFDNEWFFCNQSAREKEVTANYFCSYGEKALKEIQNNEK